MDQKKQQKSEVFGQLEFCFEKRYRETEKHNVVSFCNAYKVRSQANGEEDAFSRLIGHARKLCW